MKPVFASLIFGEENPQSKGIAYLLASVVAGAVAAILLCPMESTRIRIVTDKDYKGMGLLTGLPKLIQDEGTHGCTVVSNYYVYIDSSFSFF